MQRITKFGLAGLTMLSPMISNAAAKKQSPNIIYIMLDDLGKEWVDCYGAEGIELPNVTKLAETGMRFNNVYSMPQCTPSRVSFLTGQYPFRNGWVNHWDVPRWGGGAHFDEKKNPSLPLLMQKAGYVTAAVGKWQIDDFRVEPKAMEKVGFDDYCMWTGYETGVPASAKRYWNPYIHTKNGSSVHKDKFGEDIFTDFLIDFMTKNREKPMFLYYPMCLPHTPFTTTPLEKDAKGKYDQHKAMVRYTDFILGRIVKALDDLKIRNNTIIIWTTDNGSTGSLVNVMNKRKVKGGKIKYTENGVNAPFIVNCPGIVPQGKTTNALVDFTDMLPTFAQLAGVKPSDKFTYDGFSFADLICGKSADSNRQWIMAMGGRNEARLVSHGNVQNKYKFRDRIVRDKRHKVYFGLDRKPYKMYDLLKDPAEEKNIIGNPELKSVLEKLSKLEKTWPSEDQNPTFEANPKQAWDVKYKTAKREKKRKKK